MDFFLWEYQCKIINQCTPLVIRNKQTHREIDKADWYQKKPPKTQGDPRAAADCTKVEIPVVMHHGFGKCYHWGKLTIAYEMPLYDLL